MKVHSEISISRVVLYISFLVSLSGGSLDDKNLPNAAEPNGSQNDSITDEYNLMKNLQDTGADQHPVYKHRVDK
jgi:hypothetical protein